MGTGFVSERGGYHSGVVERPDLLGMLKQCNWASSFPHVLEDGLPNSSRSNSALRIFRYS